MTHLPSVVYPSHGGIANPNWRHTPGGADIRKTIARAKQQVVGPVTRTKIALVCGRVVQR